MQFTPSLFPRAALFATLLALPVAPAFAQVSAPMPAASSPAPAQITVTGEGRIASKPDLATLTLGVETRGESANSALAENTAATNQVIEQLKAAGIAARDMQTSSLTLGPNWEHPEGQPARIQGFVASNMVTVTVRDLKLLGGVLDAVVKNGANTFQGLAFGLGEPRPKQDEARRAAVADALAKAQLYADAAGLKLGPVISLAEGSEGQPRPMMRMAAAESAAPVALAEGEVTIQAQVTMVFSVQP